MGPDWRKMRQIRDFLRSVGSVSQNIELSQNCHILLSQNRPIFNFPRIFLLHLSLNCHILPQSGPICQPWDSPGWWTFWTILNSTWISSTQGCPIRSPFGPDWHQMEQFWGAKMNRRPRFVPFGANLAQLESKIGHPCVNLIVSCYSEMAPLSSWLDLFSPDIVDI